MVNLIKIPVKIAIGTSIGIIFISSLFGVLGKFLSMQIEYLYALPIIVGSIITAQFGAKVSKKTSPNVLKITLLFVILLSFIQVVLKIYE